MADFNLNYNSFELLHELGYTIQETPGLEGAPIRIASAELTGAHGGNIWNRLYGMRQIDIKGFVWGDTAEEYLDRVESLIQAFQIDSEDSLIVTLWDGRQKRIGAKVIEAPKAPKKVAEVTTAEFTIKLLCEDPFWRDLADTVQTTGLGVPGGGAIPTAVPMSLSPSTGDTITIVNSGDEPFYASMKISGDVTDATVLNVTTGKQFQISGNISAGNFVRLSRNQGGSDVKYNDTQDYYNYLSGRLFPIAVGTNEIKFTASTYSGSAQLEVTYNNRYLAL